MQRTLNLPPANYPEVESNPIFNVLIAYEDFETGKHAKETYDFLAQNLGREYQLTSQMWKFDVLGISKLREIAVHDATLADIILVSSHGNPLPEQVTKWAESWSMEGTQALALVALFGGDDERNPNVRIVRDYLASLAKRGQMEFFAQTNVWPGVARRSSGVFVPAPPAPPAHHIPSDIRVVQRDVVPRWGINE